MGTDLGIYLRRCREAAGFGQSLLAKKLRDSIGEEIAPYYVNKIERGAIKQPDVDRLRLICEIVGADFDRALELGGYPGYQASEAHDNLPPLLAGRLGALSDQQLEALDELWPAIEELVRKFAGGRTVTLRPVAEEAEDYGALAEEEGRPGDGG